MDTWAGQAGDWTWNNGQDVARIGFGTFDVALGVSMVWTGAGTLPGIGLIAIGLDQLATGAMNLRYGRIGQGFSIIEFGAYSATGDATLAILTPGILSLGFGSLGSLGRLGVRAGVPGVVIAGSGEGGAFGLLSLSYLGNRQLAIHRALAESGATAFFLKRGVSMRDLRAIGRVTGDEYAMYTLGSRRFVIRGYANEIRVTEVMAAALSAGRYGRWSGHTHPPGFPISASTVDRWSIPLGQQRSAVWGDGGFRRFHRTPQLDKMFDEELNRILMRRYYAGQQ